MELVILTKEQYDEIIKRLNTLNEGVRKINSPSKEKFLDNSEFISLMKVSKRTAQTWRDEGKISFSQVGSKIYYLLSDVETFIQEHRIKAFHYKRRNPV